MLFSSTSVTASALVALSAISSVAAHGYMSTPPVRGIQKESYSVDSLKAPNWGGALCRGEPAGTVTTVSNTVTLGFTITAPHVGLCQVFILDADLTNSVKVAEKLDCAAPGKVGPWTITIPSNITGRKVIRWYWSAAHVTPNEPYENCADVNIGGSSTGSNPAPEATSTTSTTTPASTSTSSASAPTSGSSTGAYTPTPAPAPAPSSGSGSCQPNQYTCNADGRLGQCNFGKYVWIKCATGTTCRSSGNYHYCGY
ncbi:hypothetical protein BDF19DRAFT_437202 [Syncephalis fuscata]|nr:hypothetical protein BDF19DRAFT_437202 [Syncephalis fuscata]